MALARKISNSADVEAAIKELQLKISVQESEMKEQVADVKYNLAPKKVINDSFSFVSETPEIQKTIINIAIGFILGYASKKAIQLLREESINRTVESLVSNQLTKFENQDPNSFISRVITLIRKNTPQDSPIYPLVKYQDS